MRDQGYLIMAVDSHDTDYGHCARQLAHSIRSWHPNADITIVTAGDLLHGDQGGQANDWQLYEISPYHETIKLEADMLVCSEIDHWWDLFRQRDMVISRGCRDFRDQTGTSRYYRKIFDDNQLPDLYNALTYWRISHTARNFFRWCRVLWQHWSQYRTLLKFSPDTPNCDLVYAMAAVLTGVDSVTLPNVGPRITHMKQHIIGTQGPSWTQELIWEYHGSELRINTVAQWGLLHYVEKDWDPDGR